MRTTMSDLIIILVISMMMLALMFGVPAIVIGCDIKTVTEQQTEDNEHDYWRPFEK